MTDFEDDSYEDAGPESGDEVLDENLAASVASDDTWEVRLAEGTRWELTYDGKRVGLYVSEAAAREALGIEEKRLQQ